MQPALAILVCALVATSNARPRQNEETNNNRLDEPLADPELRRTLLRVFAESLKAAAEAGIQAAKKADSGTTDLRPPQSEAAAEEGFNSEQQRDELLILSGGDTAATGRSLGRVVVGSTEQPLLQPAESRDAEALTTVLPTSDNGLSSPAPSPAPPQPTVTLENLKNLPASDSADVQRFVDAVSNTPDEKLGSGVELLKAPLIAAFALQQDEDTGKTRNLFAYPVPQGNEELLRNERLTLSVAGQVAGRQGVTFNYQPTPEASFVNEQGAAPLHFRDQQSFFESDNALRRLEKQQQLLQEQLVSLQRERAVLLQRNQRPTRSETLVPAESNVFITRSLPIYLQPPFF